jgi:dTDP-4-amino-4,6-dideoxygalactose transaminase
MKIRFVDLNAQYESIKSEIDDAIRVVVNETAFIGGKHVINFEKNFAEIYNVDHVISCANGTDSLFVIMKMLGIGQGDEVITSANSWISSSETITQAGARPVFVDIDPVYYSINEKLLEDAITPKTKAIIAVHLQGQMCEIFKIKDICDRHGIALIEDCAQSHFSEYNGIKAGLIGIAGSFSFYPGKNLGAYGDAGCIITNDSDLGEKCRMYSRHGALKKHEHKIEGINSRLDGIQAAILSAKLPHIHKWTENRITNANLYHKYLGDIEEIILPVIRPNTKHTWHLFVIRAKSRDNLVKFLAEKKGIETAIHYPKALPNLAAYKYLEYKENAFPVATKYQDEILSIPMYPELSEEMIIFISKSIREFYNN